MPCAERIILTLLSFAKATDPPQLSQSGELLATARKHLVGVALVCHVPDNIVFGHVEDVVERDGEFDDSERGGEVPAGFGD